MNLCHGRQNLIISSTSYEEGKLYHNKNICAH